MIVLAKSIKIIFCIVSVCCLFLFASCKNTEPENVDVRTTLSIDASFKGTRTVVLTFPSSIVAAGSETEINLDKVVQKYCPDTMSYSKNTTDGEISYTFVIEFTSTHEYITKTTGIIGSKTVVSFSNPNTVMTKGWKLEESFQSTELLSWIETGARQEGFEEFGFIYDQSKTTAALDDDVQNADPIISVNTLSGSPVQNIQITTVNKGSVYDRTIVFNISQTTFDSVSTSISDYFKSVTDASASSAEWLLENNYYLYTVKFNDISLRELEGYTNKLLGSVYCEASYEDKSVGSTPLASQNTFTEALDFSNYIGNSNANVPIEYTYSVADSGELGECQLYDGSSWSAATDLLSTNKYGSLVAVKSNDSFLTLRISDGKQYTASSINVSVTPLENEKIRKSITFKYDIATGGIEASDYTKSYFDSVNIDSTQEIENDKKTCTVSFIGTADEINSKIESIFGTGNRITYASYVPFMTLRTTKQFTDSVDLSSLIIGKNIDTPIYYSVAAENGDIVKSLTINNVSSENSEENTAEQIELADSSLASSQLSSSKASMSFDVSVLNVSDVVTCVIITVIIIILSFIVILILRSRMQLAPVQPEQENNSRRLKSGKNSLVKSGKKHIKK